MTSMQQYGDLLNELDQLAASIEADPNRRGLKFSELETIQGAWNVINRLERDRNVLLAASSAAAQWLHDNCEDDEPLRTVRQAIDKAVRTYKAPQT